MKKIFTALLLITCPLTLSADENAPAPNGLQLPKGYDNWKLIASSHREDNQSLRVILGNTVAHKAIKSGQTKPWPDGTILAKLVWKDRKHPKWPSATIPGKFLHTEIMIKNTEQYAETGGWGYARWLGKQLRPYGKDASFAKECYQCHAAVKKQDYVFTYPAMLP